MFLLPDGRPLALDVAFNIGDTYFPANWLRLSSPDERTSVGITEVADPPAPPDQRFYWGWDQDGNPIPKDHGQLVVTWTDQTRVTANTLLFPTDWVIVREVDNGTPASQDVKDWRQAIRVACEQKVSYIAATTTTDELAAYITGPDYPVWPPQTVVPTEPTPAADSIIFDPGIISSQFN